MGVSGLTRGEEASIEGFRRFSGYRGEVAFVLGLRGVLKGDLKG